MAGNPKGAREKAISVLDRASANPEAPELLGESVTTTNEAAEARQRLEGIVKQTGETAGSS